MHRINPILWKPLLAERANLQNRPRIVRVVPRETMDEVSSYVRLDPLFFNGKADQ